MPHRAGIAQQMESSTSETLDTGLRIRVFEPRRDEARCQEIYTRVRTATFSWVNPKRFKPSDFGPDTLGESLLVAEHRDNGVIGFVGIWRPENFIHHLYILPEFQRTGIGRALLDSALRTIARPAKLKCQSANTNARGFYQHLGWREGEQGQDEIGRWIEFVLD
jgi:GNAT superfamily N-acetyltransferase